MSTPIQIRDLWVIGSFSRRLRYIDAMPIASDPASDDLNALRAALVQERAALAAEQMSRREAEARASGAEAMVAHLKLLIAKLRHEKFGASSERQQAAGSAGAATGGARGHGRRGRGGS